LAQEGVVYEQAISPAGWSLPSHASLFTGLYPSKHGAHDEHHYLAPSVPTLAEELANAGYVTVGYCGNPWVSDATGLTRGFQRYDDLRPRHPGPRRQLDRALRKMRAVVSGRPARRADLTTERAARDLARLARGDRPFFMFVHYNEPHTPRHLPRHAATRFLGPEYGWEDAEPLSRDVNGYIAGAVQWSPRDLDVFTRLYDAALAYDDERIGQLIETLRAAGALDDTVVVVTADHGENLGEHALLGHKLCLYDTLLRVPLIVRYPGAFPRGERVRRQVQGVDLAPTLYALLGLADRWLDQPGGGRSLLEPRDEDLAIAEQYRPNLAVLTERYPTFDPAPHDRRLRAVRTTAWKFIWASDGRHELYDLVSDPGETRNVVDERPDVAASLARRH
ncbi:MAG: sulfatase, partial [Thermomicrobiaceae bacterium]|nr:sulfatase [Thermomicrobiaceae bacterium]